MADTLRSVVGGMDHETGPMLGHSPACHKCRIEMLLDAAEKTDLVQKWRRVSTDMRKVAKEERQFARRCQRSSNEREKHLKQARDFEGTAKFYEDRADELTAWFAARRDKENVLIEICNEAWLEQLGAYLAIHGFNLQQVIVAVRERLAARGIQP